MEAPGPLLVVTRDAELLDAALRWCAAVGVTPDVRSDVAGVRPLWRRAAAIVVGHDVDEELSRVGLMRRSGVGMVNARGEPHWAAAVDLGVEAVFNLSDGETEVLDWLTTALDGTGEACVMSVVGGSGGVGASTLAAALCIHAERRGVRPLLVDTDPWAGGSELLLGTSLAHGLSWPDLADTTGRIASSTLSDVVPVVRGVAALSWAASETATAPSSLTSVLTAAERGFDLVVADVPRHHAVTAHDAMARSVLTVVVVAEEVRALAAARHTMSMVRASTSMVGVVTLAKSGGTGSSVVSDVLEAPILARIRPDRGLRPSVDAGLGPGRSRTLRRACGSVLDAVGIR